MPNRPMILIGKNQKIGTITSPFNCSQPLPQLSQHIIPKVQLNSSVTLRAYSNAAGLTHVDDSGRCSMVDVGHKPATERIAVAKGTVHVGQEVTDLIHRNTVKKGDVLTVAQLAGIVGAKKTPELIPLCHSVPLTLVQVEVVLNRAECSVEITCLAKCSGRTGVEMEALTGVSVAALTVYDMCKAVSKSMVIRDISLVKKSGGKTVIDVKDDCKKQGTL